MLDTRYALKYHMPHSLLHIVDNSMNTGETVPTVADDPSLYATIVVSGAPIGQDRTIVKLDRTDIAAASFGLGNLTTEDIKKYGQSVTYPMALLSEAQAPVRFMRLTPDDATYAFRTILVQWRIDEDTKIMHVRFKQVDQPPVGLRYDMFKNTDRLNAALIAANANNKTDDDSEGNTWNQRVFMNVIAAGRGSVYNNMAFMVDLGSQSRRPANCRYMFTTYDTSKSAAVERFTASLINTNTNNYNAIDSVNVIVKRRVPGSSIVIPYVNESAIIEVFNAYMENLKEQNDVGNIDPNLTEVVQNQMYAMLNVNIFDIIYGNYIYNTDVDYKLPFYQVDMLDTDIAQLPESQRIAYGPKSTITPADEPLYIDEVYSQKLKNNTFGVFADGGSTYVGDIYLSQSGKSNMNPTLNMVAAINQYSGAITSVAFNKVYTIGTSALESDSATILAYVTDTTTSSIATDFGDTTKQIRKLYDKGYLKADVKTPIAIVYTNSADEVTFDLVQVVVNAGDTPTLVATPYTGTTSIYNAIVYSEINGVGNVIGYDATVSAYSKVGYLVIADNEPKINSYVPGTGSPNPNPVAIGPTGSTINHLKFGAVPTSINIPESVIGLEYDVMAYTDADIKTGSVTAVTVTTGAGGTGYSVNDVVTCADLPGVEFVVTAVDSGVVTAIKVDSNKSIATFSDEIPYKDTGYNDSATTSNTGTNLKLDITVKPALDNTPQEIQRFVVSGTIGSLFKVVPSPEVIINNYYSDDLGLNMGSDAGGFKLENGSTGFFDDPTISDIEFKWRYQALLVKAFKGEIDPRIKSVSRCPAKFLFDGGHNTILGMTIVPNVAYTPADIINASTIFTDDEKDAIIYDPSIIDNLSYEDIDVKQAMYDLMVYRCFQGLPEDMRPEGSGYGMQLYLDSGNVDFTTAQLMNSSFAKRFDNPNASWDIGGYVRAADGLPYTFTYWIMRNMFAYCKRTSINKPFAEGASMIPPSEYTSFYPDLDATDWDLRELIYNSGGNGWIQDVNGNLVRKSQRTMYAYAETSDLVQESNMRTLSQFCYMLQNKIDSRLLDYSEDGVLRTLKDECDNMFTNWRGNLVQDYDLEFRRDTNPTDGGDIVVCDVTLVFRGLILRAAIIVNVQRRTSTT